MADSVSPALPTPPAGPAPIPTDQRRTDANYLRALSIFHYLLAALNAAIIACGVYSMVRMAMIMSQRQDEMIEPGHPSLMPPWWHFGGVMLIIGGIYGAVMVLNAASGWCLARRKAWAFSVVVAGLDLLYLPFGTVLGICTLIVLLRGSVSALYEEGPVVQGRVGYP